MSPLNSIIGRVLNVSSDPFHDRYGEHLTKEEVEALVAPHDESVHLVNEWLASHGLYEDSFSRSPARDWVVVKVPVSLAEEMLKTVSMKLSKTRMTRSNAFPQEYHVWTHDASGDVIVRTTAYSLPEHLHDHVELVQPTTMFSRFKGLKTTFHFEPETLAKTTALADVPPIKVPSASNGEVDASCNGTITISCLQQLYNAVGFTPSAKDGNGIGITGYLEQYANNQDLQSFYADQRPDALNSTYKEILINGTCTSRGAWA